MGVEETLAVRTAIRNGVVNITLGGELDLATVSILEEELAAHDADAFVGTVLDLRDLRFMDSSGLHAVVRAKGRSAAKDRRFVVIGATASVRGVFELTRLEFLLDDAQAVALLDQFTASEVRRSLPDRVAGTALDG